MKAVAVRTEPKLFGKMTAPERAYYEFIRFDPDVLWWTYQPGSLRIANGTRYSPDFAVVRKNRILVYTDTKGGKMIRGKWQPYCRSRDARVRIAVAAQQYPWAVFAFAWQSREKTHWLEEVFS